ncbi:MAG: aminodeoxychorismate/anthranilate synthase component II [Pirellulales bacterium]
MILIVDNYDSFTYNLVQRLGEIDPRVDVRVVRNDQTTPEAIWALEPERIIISPGPCTPNEAGISVDCVRYFAGKIPLLGVCLGHQSIGQAFGGRIVRARQLMHGKTDMIHHDNQGLFAGVQNPFRATRYHSLVIEPESVPEELIVCAWNDDPRTGREIMAVRHATYPVYGWQFHPESFLTDIGSELLQRFLELEVAA